MKYLVSVSGGKDSTAVLLYALNHLPKKDIVVYFCDTGWEHKDTYRYLEYLEEKLDIKIERLQNYTFKELAVKKKFVPTMFKRYCTAVLKDEPAKEFIKTFTDKGIDIINLVGIRRDESKARANAETFLIYNGVKTLQPIAYWSEKRVFEYIAENGLEPNPLYKRGFGRVGCYPCIFARKFEIENLEDEYIERVRDLEKAVTEVAGMEIKFFLDDRKNKLLKRDQKSLFDTEKE